MLGVALAAVFANGARPAARQAWMKRRRLGRLTPVRMDRAYEPVVDG
jgi:hypothetical protein